MKKLFSFLFLVLLLFLGCGNNNDSKLIEASGTIEATNIIISAKSNGEIISLLLQEGDKVNKGDTILIIDHEILDLQLQQAIAMEDIAKAQLKLLQKGARKEDIKQVQEVFNQAKLNYNAAEKDYERMKKLVASNSISGKLYEDSETRYNLLKAQLKAAEENLTKFENLARPEELDQAKGNLKKATANVNLIKKNISDCFVVSPIDGFIVKKLVELGETVNPMSNLVKISDLMKVKLVVYVNALELPKVKLGQKAEIKIDYYKDRSFEGKVIYISPEAEFTPKNIQTKDERVKQVFAIKIEIINKDLELKPGLPADAILKF